MSIPDPASIRNNAGEALTAPRVYTGVSNKSSFKHTSGGHVEVWSFTQAPSKTRNRIICRYDWTGTPDAITGIRPTQSVNMTLDVPLSGPNAYLDSNIEVLAATTRHHLTRLLNGEL